MAIDIITNLTQGHLEAYQEAFRKKLQPVQQANQEPVMHFSQPLDFTLRLDAPAKFAYPFYQQFLALVQTRETPLLSKPEQYGLMVRAALLSGWIVDAPWQVEEVASLPAKLVSWLGAKLDETYSDYDFAIEEIQVQAAEQASWFLDTGPMPTEPQEIEAVAKLVQAAYRAATDIAPE